MNTQCCKVLVVDDTEDVLDTVAGTLADAGYSVKKANCEEKAKTTLENETFHFLVIDIRLRGHTDEDDSGIELVKTIRELGVQSKIIFITGKTIEARHFKPVIEYGVIDYIEKTGDWTESICKIIEEEYLKFDVFLCHNSEDKPMIKTIGKNLNKRGLRPWLDEWELQPGLPWQVLVEQQIEEIKSAAVFVGKSGVGPWQQMEIRGLLSEFVNRGIPVIPVILNNAPEKPKLPLFLREMTWVDFRENEPDPLQQLIWGITGEKY
jgi:ActR/RegA family two-component response regulator